MLRLSLLLMFTLILAACSSLTNTQITENYEAAKRYFEDPKVINLQPDEFDIPQFDKHLMSIEHYIRANKLSTKEHSILIKQYINEVRYLNYAKLRRNLPINKEQINYAISLADQYRSLFSDSSYQKITFIISRIYALVLHDTKTAQTYLLSCAKLGDAACSNIAAHNYLYGKDGFPTDIERAIYWSKRTVSTGTKYNCAGIFSAKTLMWISRFYPEASTGKDWREWLRIAKSLSHENVQASPSRYLNTNVCEMSDAYLAEFIFDLKEGVENKEALETSIALQNLDHRTDYNKALQKLPESLSLTELDKALSAIKQEGEFCDAIHYFYLMANIQHDKKKSVFLRDKVHERKEEACPEIEEELGRTDHYF